MSAALGEPDRDFERQMLIAGLQWNLDRLALEIAGELRRHGVRVSAVNIEYQADRPRCERQTPKCDCPLAHVDNGCSKNE